MPDAPGEDLFDDPALRNAVATAFGFRVRNFGDAAMPQWCFERSRLGLRRIEISPLGLYSAVHDSPGPHDVLRRFIAASHGGLRTSLRVNVNPLEPRASELADAARSCGWRVEPHTTHVLHVGDSIEDLRRGYHATKRSQARRGNGPASVISVAQTPTQIDDYVAAYDASVARWGASGRTYPRELFVALQGCPSARIWTNHVEGRLACAMVVLYCRRYALYWHGVSHIEADQKAAFPMVRLMDRVLADLAERGIAQMNMGASDGLPNVRRFKEEFGARPADYVSLVKEAPIARALAWARRIPQRG